MNQMSSKDLKWPEQGIGKCCHTVLAMLSGRPIREIVELAKTIGLAGDRMSLPCMRVACRELGINIKSWEIYRGFVYEGNELPPDCIVFTSTSFGDDIETVAHVMLRLGNQYYDPYHHGKTLYHFPAHQIITQYAEIDTQMKWQKSADGHTHLESVWIVGKAK